MPLRAGAGTRLHVRTRTGRGPRIPFLGQVRSAIDREVSYDRARARTREAVENEPQSQVLAALIEPTVQSNP